MVRATRSGAVRLDGLGVLIGIVLLGMGSGAAYFHWKAPRIRAQVKADLAAAPTTAAGRLAHWYEIGAAQIHHRLTKVARFSADMPWIVTHAVEDAAGGEPMVFGVDTEGLPRELTHLEGLTVVVELPAPAPLGRARLSGDRAAHVPVFAADAPVPDARERLRELATWFLEGLPAALEQDIEGARVEIRIGA